MHSSRHHNTCLHLTEHVISMGVAVLKRGERHKLKGLAFEVIRK